MRMSDWAHLSGWTLQIHFPGKGLSFQMTILISSFYEWPQTCAIPKNELDCWMKWHTNVSFQKGFNHRFASQFGNPCGCTRVAQGDSNSEKKVAVRLEPAPQRKNTFVYFVSDPFPSPICVFLLRLCCSCVALAKCVANCDFDHQIGFASCVEANCK